MVAAAEAVDRYFVLKLMPAPLVSKDDDDDDDGGSHDDSKVAFPVSVVALVNACGLRLMQSVHHQQ